MTVLTNKKPAITIVGLGPGDPALVTRKAWDVLSSAEEVFLRTDQHPTALELKKLTQINSFDSVYQQADTFDKVYAEIVDQVIRLGQRPQGVLYAVPGHPWVGEATTPEIVVRARENKLSINIIDGLSFVEPSLALLELDVLPQLTIIDALVLGDLHVAPFPPNSPILIAQIYSQQVAANVKLTLVETYPEEHPVRLLHAAGSADAWVEPLPLYAIDRSTKITAVTSLFVPPLEPDSSMEAFQEVIAHLRAPDGCPWDKEQDHLSLRPYLLEETYELIQALDEQDISGMKEELGDLLLQILLHTQIAHEEGEFNIYDVLKGVNRKIISRHPHVFGDVSVNGSLDVVRNWEKLKAAEREFNGKENNGLLDSIPVALPALNQAEEYQRRAARVGFDWKEIEGVWLKVYEEFQELKNAQAPAERQEELGDLFFAIVNLARWLDIDAESALRGTNVKFKRRLDFINQKVKIDGKTMSDLSLEELDRLWDQAKREQS